MLVPYLNEHCFTFLVWDHEHNHSNAGMPDITILGNRICYYAEIGKHYNGVLCTDPKKRNGIVSIQTVTQCSVNLSYSLKMALQNVCVMMFPHLRSCNVIPHTANRNTDCTVTNLARLAQGSDILTSMVLQIMAHELYKYLSFQLTFTVQPAWWKMAVQVGKNVAYRKRYIL